MAQTTGIEWTNHTLNLWWGCTEVHSGCDNCYAREWAKRWEGNIWGLDSPRVEKPNAFKELVKWQKNAAKDGVMRYVFCSSMSDIFEKPMPVIKQGELQPYKTDALRNRLFQEIEAGLYPNLIFQFLTKRPSNINKMIPESWAKNRSPRNVMFGTSISRQKDMVLFDHLFAVNGKTFLSIEPLLEPLNLPLTVGWNKGVDWVIVGGESGTNARPMHPDWVRSIRDQCQTAGVPFFFKQWGEYLPMTQCHHLPNWGALKSSVIMNEYGDTDYVGIQEGRYIGLCKLGKTAAGNLLDGVNHENFPNF